MKLSNEEYMNATAMGAWNLTERANLHLWGCEEIEDLLVYKNTVSVQMSL